MCKYNITPKNTELDYLLNHPNWLHELAVYLDDSETLSQICSSYGCGECPLRQENFSPDIFGHSHGCVDARTAVQTISKVVKATSDSKTEKTTGSCATCAYYIKQGEYPYCTAWHNFTTKDMYCGYYKAIDK